MKYLVASCLAAAVAISPLAQAGEIESGAGIVLGEKLGLLSPDSQRNLDDDMFVEFFGGYRFGPKWEVDFGYVTGGFDGENGGQSGKIDPGFSLSAVYHFLNGKWQPYASVGVTDYTYDYAGLGAPDVDGDVNLAGAAGIKRFFGPKMFVLGEIKQVFDQDEGDTMLSLGMGYLLGQSKGTAKPKPAAAPKPAPVRASDFDNDGVVDQSDNCPNTTYGVSVDSMGCALDSDSDGVADHKDECANTSVGANIDAGGCEVEFVTQKASIEISVQFATNSSVLTGDSSSEIRKAASFMKKYSGSTLVVEGHTDSMGAAEYNKFLSQKRADKVMEILVNEFGVSASRVTAVGYGEERPVADNSTASGRQQNRRVVGVVEGQTTVRKQ